VTSLACSGNQPSGIPIPISRNLYCQLMWPDCARDIDRIEIPQRSSAAVVRPSRVLPSSLLQRRVIQAEGCYG
jgi:hypothetical protein